MARYIRVNTKEEVNQIIERENKKHARENWFVNVSVKESRKGGYTVKNISRIVLNLKNI